MFYFPNFILTSYVSPKVHNWLWNVENLPKFLGVGNTALLNEKRQRTQLEWDLFHSDLTLSPHFSISLPRTFEQVFPESAEAPRLARVCLPPSQSHLPLSYLQKSSLTFYISWESPDNFRSRIEIKYKMIWTCKEPFCERCGSPLGLKVLPCWDTIIKFNVFNKSN